MRILRQLKHRCLKNRKCGLVNFLLLIICIGFVGRILKSKFRNKNNGDGNRRSFQLVTHRLSDNKREKISDTNSSTINKITPRLILSTTVKTTTDRPIATFTEPKEKKLSQKQVGKLRRLVQKYSACLKRHFVEISDSIISPSFYETEEELRRRCFVEMFGTASGNICKWPPKKLVGPLYVNFTALPLDELHRTELGYVQVGGKWKPKHCASREEVALIIPFRDREEHLSVFLRQIHSVLRRQEYTYRILVIEQKDEYPFNRGKLMNVGFKEALKISATFSCFIFHDVDLIPENDNNDYGCPTSPRHMSHSVDKFNYILPYKGIFGGVEAFKRNDFERINGFPNAYWGWGAEDDCLYKRVIQSGYTLTRPDSYIGRYKMIKHSHSNSAPPNRMDKLNNARAEFQTDGISSLQYKVLNSEIRQLYTFVQVDLNMEGDSIY